MAILKDKSKKKKGENIIGKIIYGFLLFAPILSILTTCLYVIFNKNAYLSYYGTSTNEQNEDLAGQTLNTNEQYYIVYNNDLLTGNSSPYVYINEINNIEWYGSPNQTIIDNIENYTYFRIYYNPNGNLYSWSFYKNDNSVTYSTLGNIRRFDFTVDRQQSNPFLTSIYQITFVNNSYLDNVFEYSINKIEESNYYNWSKATGTYTVLQTTTSQIGITNTFVPMLMAYWLLISIIYFIFDIALILIWAVHDKIHELKDAI